MSLKKWTLSRELTLHPPNPGSLGSVQQLYKSIKQKKNPTITLAAVKKSLQRLDAYTLHKTRRYRFKRNKFIIRGIDDLWQADLADLSAIARFNDGNRYLLVVIDSFSKRQKFLSTHLWAEPTKKKDAKTVMEAIKVVLRKARPRKPRNWLVDKGGEFQNLSLQRFMVEQHINFYYTKSPDTKAAIAERVIRTLKGRTFKFLSYNNSWRYLDHLNVLVDSYNHAKHRTIGMAPTNVSAENSDSIRQRMYPPQTNVQPKYKLRVGDQVRLAKKRDTFQKGYHAGWTEEIFVVAKRLPRNPPVYQVKDVSEEMVEGVFYTEELQKVMKETDDEYKVEAVLAERMSGGKKEYLIKWLGYPESMATWEPEDNIRLL